MMTFLILTTLGFSVLAQAETNAQASDAQIATLFDQLGSKQFREREAATQAIQKIGLGALPALEKAAAHGDAEVRRRLAGLVEAIRIEHESELLLRWYRGLGFPD